MCRRCTCTTSRPACNFTPTVGTYILPCPPQVVTQNEPSTHHLASHLSQAVLDAIREGYKAFDAALTLRQLTTLHVATLTVLQPPVLQRQQGQGGTNKGRVGASSGREGSGTTYDFDSNEGQKSSQVVRSQTRFWVVSTVCHMYMTVQSAVPDITFLNGFSSFV